MTLRSQTMFLDVAGKKTQLTRGGSGPPLLYLHSAAGETEWTDLHEALAARYTLYVPAHPGFALSEGLDRIDDVFDLAWHYVDLLDALELPQVPIVGFSLGAWIALELCLLRPERVSRMVLIDSAGLHLPDAPVAELFIDNFDKLRRLLFFEPEGEAARKFMPESLEDPRILLWLRAREATARVGWNPYLHDPRLPGHLHRIATLTLVIWGRHDRLIPLAHGEYLTSHLPHASLHVLENCGHMAPFEQPGEIAARVFEFFA